MSTETGRRREILVHIAKVHANAPILSYFFPRTDRRANVAELVLISGTEKPRQNHEPWKIEGYKKRNLSTVLGPGHTC
jgi:hypothetical protein